MGVRNSTHCEPREILYATPEEPKTHLIIFYMIIDVVLRARRVLCETACAHIEMLFIPFSGLTSSWGRPLDRSLTVAPNLLVVYGTLIIIRSGTGVGLRGCWLDYPSLLKSSFPGTVQKQSSFKKPPLEFVSLRRFAH